MTDIGPWLAEHTGTAPPLLRARLLAYAGPLVAAAEPAQALAGAGWAALDQVTERPGDRSVALDLLAADGLITLALLWCAEHHPERLAALARSLTEPAAPRD